VPETVRAIFREKNSVNREKKEAKYMGRSSKPIMVLQDEKKFHITKAEIALRKKAEEALLTKIKLKEKAEVKNNEISHKEFLRVKKLFVAIGKNDGLYENAVNRYCMLVAECHDFEEKKELFFDDMKRLEKSLTDKEIELTAYLEMRSKISGNVIAMDKQIMQKRNMMLALEKENVMTIASALRSIPKKKEKEEKDPRAHLFG
jgi:hypothetical protein